MKERKAYSRAERQTMVLGAIAVNVQIGGSWWLTSGDIAKRLKMTNSTHLRNLMKEMVERGMLVYRDEDDPGIAGFRRLFTIPDNDLRKAIKDARKASGMDRETKAERDYRLALAINRQKGQLEMEL